MSSESKARRYLRKNVSSPINGFAPRTTAASSTHTVSGNSMEQCVR